VSGAPSALRSRVLTAVVLALVLLGVVLGLPEWATLVLVAAAVLAGGWEWSALLALFEQAPWASGLVALLQGGAVAVQPLPPLSDALVQLFGLLAPCLVAFSAARPGLRRALLVAALLAGAWLYTRDVAALRLFLLVAAAWWVVALGWLALAPQQVHGWSAGLAGLFSLVPAGVALAQIRIAPGIGAALTLFTIVLIVAADTGAFFAGRAFGRVRLAPRVSPGKTWEGVLGGLLLSTLVAFGGAAAFGVPAVSMVPVCVAAAAFSVVGDLTESMFKRHAGVKDSGSIFPGHGGILDRIDSVTSGAPVLLLGLLQIEVLP
jgi:phosphatidate cytidylyltransferase